MIKIATDHNFLVKEKAHLFFPLLSEMISNNSEAIRSKYGFVDAIEDCDVVILPLTIDYMLENGLKSQVYQMIQSAQNSDKDMWVFCSGDFGLTLNLDRVFVFRMADFKSTASRFSVVMPPFIKDPFKEIYSETIAPLSKPLKPTVGYVGLAKGGFLKYITTAVLIFKRNFFIFTKKIASDYFRFYPSSHIRLKYLKIIQSSQEIESHFICRDKYAAGVKTAEQKAKATLEFYENIKNNLYTFCMRGYGNFSVRFYETLAMGRIPLFIDTDCILPLEKIIDWKNYVLHVDEKEINDLNKKVIQFHQSKTEEYLHEMQKSNRLLWENYLTRENYFGHIHNLFIENKL